jgi:hypothetical protein
MRSPLENGKVHCYTTNFLVHCRLLNEDVYVMQARFVAVSAADRQVWFPGNAPAPHLDGSMAGDYG